MSDIYDQSLAEVGNDHKYQKRFDLVHNAVFMACWVMAYTNIVLALVVTPHTCKLPEKPDNISLVAWSLLHIPRHADDKGRTRLEECHIYANPNENNITKACEEYVYDKTWYEQTAPSDFNWVCDKELNVAYILTYSKIAEIIGSFAFGWFGDVFGRRRTYFTSIFMIVFGRLITIFSGNSYIIFLIGCVVSLFPSWTAPQTAAIISTEISLANRRVNLTTTRFLASSIGLVILGLNCWWLRDWKIFITVTTAPLIIFCILSWFTIESPRWLYTQGRIQEAIIILKKIGKVNKKELDSKTEKELTSAVVEMQSQSSSPFMLFSGKWLVLNTLCQILIWIAASSSFALLLMGAGEKSDGNPFMEFIWQAIADMPAIYLAGFLANKVGRRRTSMATFIVQASMWACTSYRENSTNEWIRQWWVGTIISGTARLATSIGYVMINIINIELHPTCLRQSGMAVGNFVSGISMALAPFILYIGRRVDSRLPGIISVVLALLGAVAAYLLPETLNAKLPETLEEAKTFGRKRKSHESLRLT